MHVLVRNVCGRNNIYTGTIGTSRNGFREFSNSQTGFGPEKFVRRSGVRRRPPSTAREVPQRFTKLLLVNNVDSSDR